MFLLRERPIRHVGFLFRHLGGRVPRFCFQVYFTTCTTSTHDVCLLWSSSIFHHLYASGATGEVLCHPYNCDVFRFVYGLGLSIRMVRQIRYLSIGPSFGVRIQSNTSTHISTRNGFLPLTSLLSSTSRGLTRISVTNFSTVHVLGMGSMTVTTTPTYPYGHATTKYRSHHASKNYPIGSLVVHKHSLLKYFSTTGTEKGPSTKGQLSVNQ